MGKIKLRHSYFEKKNCWNVHQHLSMHKFVHSNENFKVDWEHYERFHPIFYYFYMLLLYKHLLVILQVHENKNDPLKKISPHFARIWFHYFDIHLIHLSTANYEYCGNQSQFFLREKMLLQKWFWHCARLTNRYVYFIGYVFAKHFFPFRQIDTGVFQTVKPARVL